MELSNQIPFFRVLARFAAFVALTLASSLHSQEYTLDGPLPVDPLVSVGKLDNGLKYYIRSNEKPSDRVTMRLVVNAGSLQEDEGQRGLAHFIEHMAFNGTERFAKSEIVDFMERVGMRFGADLNAYTSRNETVYMLELPVDDPGVVEKGMQILRDWAGGITFDPIEIEKERGVIVEEWRTRQGAQRRLLERQYPYIYYDSRYADRDPIGSMVVVRNAPQERFLDYYNKWYRPNLMAVIVVGDIDREGMERKVKEHFGDLTNPEDAEGRPYYEVPNHDETLVSIESDPEMTIASLQILRKRDPAPDQTARDYRGYIVRNLFFTMLNRRMNEAARQPDPPFLSASVGYSRIAREKSLFQQSVVFVGDQYRRGIEAVVAETNRALRDGFGEGEFERAKADLLRAIGRAYEERDKTDSEVYAREYTRAFTVDEPIPGIAIELDLNKRFLAEITLEEVEAVGEGLEQEHSKVLLFAAPDKESFPLPEEDKLLAMVEEANEVRLAAYDDDTPDLPLLPDLPQIGSVVDEKHHESVDTREWVLSNGVRVLAKKTDFKNEQILVGSFSPGGHSLVADDEFFSGRMATVIMGESGLGAFNATQLDKKLAGKTVRMSPYLNSLYEGFQGSASPRDLEVFFQLLYLQATEPRLDMDAYASLRTRLDAMIENRDQNPETVFQDAIDEVVYGDHPRHQPLDKDLLGQLDPELALAIFKSRFSDFSDFTFIFVGALDLDELKGYCERYLASLPSTNRVEKGRFLGDHPIEGRHTVVVEKGLEEKTTARVIFTGEAEWSPENRYALIFARDLLNIRMRESLREEQGGTYGVGVFGSLSREPLERYTTGFTFSCDPGNADRLIDAGLAEIADLAQSGPRFRNVEKVKEIHLRGYESGMEENRFWLSNLMAAAREGRPLESILEHPERIENFDPADAQRAAERYFKFDNQIIAKLVPGGS